MIEKLFSLKGRVCVITGGGGMLGVKHAEAVLEAGGVAVLADIDQKALTRAKKKLKKYERSLHVQLTNITSKESLEALKRDILKRFGRIDVLINNAACNPAVRKGDKTPAKDVRFETLSEEALDREISVGLKGAFLCSQVFGTYMAKKGKGVIVNIASDLSVIAPDQRLYRKSGKRESEQPVKPVTYSLVKSGLLGLTRYLATYWAGRGVRVNALSPGGVYDGQPEEFVSKLKKLIPLGRMAGKDEYKGVIIFLCSDASSYMTGTNVIVDGGRTCW